MKHDRLWMARCAIAVMTLWVVLSCARAPLPDEGFDEEVLAMVHGVEQAWNQRDPEALASMFTESASLRSREGEWISGRGPIRTYFEDWLLRSEGSVKQIVVERSREVTHDLATVDVVSTLTPQDPSRAGDAESVSVSVIVERQTDGSWLFSEWRECPSGGNGAPEGAELWEIAGLDADAVGCDEWIQFSYSRCGLVETCRAITAAERARVRARAERAKETGTKELCEALSCPKVSTRNEAWGPERCRNRLLCTPLRGEVLCSE